MRNRLLATLLFTLALPVAVAACLWDYDTLKMERQRFPGTLEVITGKFLRHSPAFYEWRVKDRLAKIEKDPSTLSHYDDLAVAYHKLGQTPKAIEWMRKKDQLKPGLYETEANLSAFYMLSGQWEKGLEHVNKALAINPNAHFGREKYQKYLAEYVIERMKANGGKLVLPIAGSSDPSNFYDWIRDKTDGTDADFSQAIQGVLGMLRFAGHDSPVLLEVLGDLLARGRYKFSVAGHNETDAKQLATRAYLLASQSPAVSAGREAYQKRASTALTLQLPSPQDQRELTIPEVEAQLGAELKEAATWYAQLESDEKQWLAEGKNPEQEFDRKYYVEPEVAAAERPVASAAVYSQSQPEGMTRYQLVLIVLAGAILAIGIAVLVLRRRTTRAGSLPPGKQARGGPALPC